MKAFVKKGFMAELEISYEFNDDTFGIVHELDEDGRLMDVDTRMECKDPTDVHITIENSRDNTDHER